MTARLSSDNGWLKFKFLVETMRGLSEIRTREADWKCLQVDYGCRWERAERAHGDTEGEQRKEVKLTRRHNGKKQRLQRQTLFWKTQSKKYIIQHSFIYLCADQVFFAAFKAGPISLPSWEWFAQQMSGICSAAKVFQLVRASVWFGQITGSCMVWSTPSTGMISPDWQRSKDSLLFQMVDLEPLRETCWLFQMANKLSQQEQHNAWVCMRVCLHWTYYCVSLYGW